MKGGVKGRTTVGSKSLSIVKKRCTHMRWHRHLARNGCLLQIPFKGTCIGLPPKRGIASGQVVFDAFPSTKTTPMSYQQKIRLLVVQQYVEW